MARKKTTLNKKTLIGVGIASALLGIYFLAGDKIKDILKGNKDDQDTPVIEPVIEPVIQGGGSGAGSGSGSGSGSATPVIDINKKLKKGVTGTEVKKLQYIINYIAGFRGSSSYTTPSGYKVRFPIDADGSFGSDSQAGSYFISPEFRTQGYITLDQARRKLSYLAGYYRKPFPSELVNTSNYKKYQDVYKAGEIKRGQDDRAKAIGGAFTDPFNWT